jgi:5-methylcytosine-specific restriction endonuclease McrA
MTVAEPWELYPGIWKSKAAFFTYLRGQLRLTWSRYPAKLKWKAEQLVQPPKGYTGRAKKLGQCHYCGEMFAASNLEVDHVRQAGTCNSWETAAEFLYNLLNCNDNWCLACKPCHKTKSLAERDGTSFEDAKLKKKVIEFLKQPTEVIVEFCVKNGYTAGSVSNAEKRRKAVESIFKNGG